MRKNMTFSLQECEKKTIEEVAQLLNITPSEYIRRRVLSNAYALLERAERGKLDEEYKRDFFKKNR